MRNREIYYDIVESMNERQLEQFIYTQKEKTDKLELWELYKKKYNVKWWRFIDNRNIPEIAVEAWGKYKENNDYNKLSPYVSIEFWYIDPLYLCTYWSMRGGTKIICRESYKKHKEFVGRNWEFIARHGGTKDIRDDAKSHLILSK